MAPEAFPRATHADAIAPLLDHYQRVLGLADWDIRFDPTPPSEGTRAEVDGWAVKRLAAIRIAADAPIEALPRLVVHELMHLWLSQLEDLARPLMAFTPPGADATFTEQWDRMEHQLIHVLEGALTGDAHLEWGEGAPDWTRPWQLGDREPDQPIRARRTGSDPSVMATFVQDPDGDFAIVRGHPRDSIPLTGTGFGVWRALHPDEMGADPPRISAIHATAMGAEQVAV